MGENICKWCDWQELNFQNIQTAHINITIKKQTTQSKMDRRPNHFSKEEIPMPMVTLKDAQSH